MSGVRELLAVGAGLLGIIASIPYIVNTYRGTTRPNVVTWSTWTFVNAISFVAAAAIEAGETALFAAGSTVATGAILVLGWSRGNRKYTRFDALCQILAVLGIVLWRITGFPALAILLNVAVNIIGVLPTVRHAWRSPGEETRIAFVLGGMSALIDCAAQPGFRLAALAIPLVVFVNNAAVVTAISIRGFGKDAGPAVASSAGGEASEA